MPEGASRHECCNCGVVFWITDYLQENRLKDASTFYCPNGHAQSYGKSEADKVRDHLAIVQRERDRLKQNEARYEQELEAARTEAARLAKRVGAGVCPCCNRSFANLRNHMAGNHPDYYTPREPQEASRQRPGGLARAAALTAARRSEIASKAAKARWGKEVSA